MKKNLLDVGKLIQLPKQISSNWRNTFYAIMSIMVLLLSNTINAQSIKTINGLNTTETFLNPSAASLGEPFVGGKTYNINDYIYQVDLATPAEINIYRVSKAGFAGTGAADATFATNAKVSITQTNVTFTYVGFVANATQTFTCPAGVSSFTVTAYGGGGAGGSVNNAAGTSDTNRIAASGGGAGSTVSNTFTRANSSTSATYNVIVGQGGYKGGTNNGSGFYGHRGGKSEISGAGITTLTASGGTGGGGAGPYNRVANGGGTLGGVYGFYIGTNGTTMTGYTNGIYPNVTSSNAIASCQIASAEGYYTEMAGPDCFISSSGGAVLHIVVAKQGAGYTIAPTVSTTPSGTNAPGINGEFTALINPNINSGGSDMVIGTKGFDSTGTADKTGAAGAGGGFGPEGSGGGAAGKGGTTLSPGTGGDAVANSSCGGGGAYSSTTNGFFGGLGGSGKVVITYATPTTMKTIENALTGFKLYPNPSKSNSFNVVVPQGINKASLTVSNLLGQKLYSQSDLQSGVTTTVNVSNVKTAGVYLVSLTSEGKTSTTKWIVE